MKIVTNIVSLTLLMLSLSLSAKHLQHESHSKLLIIEITLIGDFTYPAKGPFGQLISSSVTVANPYQYNTKYTDEETGFVYYGYRYYNSATGRWLNQDPIGIDGGINVYNSVSNNMVNGFAGGMSWSAGMSRDVGDSSESMGVDAWGNYEFDVHQFLTEFLAVSAGIGAKYAEKIGVQTQALDAKGDSRDAMHKAFGFLPVNWANMKKYHFVSSDRLMKLSVYAFTGKPTLREIGEYFHALEDTYSHSTGIEDRNWKYYGDFWFKKNGRPIHQLSLDKFLLI
jgi:RHS repeat-associated protein